MVRAYAPRTRTSAMRPAWRRSLQRRRVILDHAHHQFLPPRLPHHRSGWPTLRNADRYAALPKNQEERSPTIYVIPDGKSLVLNIAIIVGSKGLVVDTGLGARNGQAIMRGREGQQGRRCAGIRISTPARSRRAAFRRTRMIRSRDQVAESRVRTGDGKRSQASRRTPRVLKARVRKADRLFVKADGRSRWCSVRLMARAQPHARRHRILVEPMHPGLGDIVRRRCRILSPYSALAGWRA
jgi:hypothetical protein